MPLGVLAHEFAQADGNLGIPSDSGAQPGRWRRSMLGFKLCSLVRRDRQAADPYLIAEVAVIAVVAVARMGHYASFVS